MAVYSVDKLMAETRRLAAEYYRTTQQTLPVSHELARYDACKLLGLTEEKSELSGVDAIDSEELTYQIKSRVVFDAKKLNRCRVGQLNIPGKWHKTLLVLLNDEYQAVEIYAAKRGDIEEALNISQNPNRLKRGAMSIGRFIAISEKVWGISAV